MGPKFNNKITSADVTDLIVDNEVIHKALQIVKYSLRTQFIIYADNMPVLQIIQIYEKEDPLVNICGLVLLSLPCLTQGHMAGTDPMKRPRKIRVNKSQASTKEY